MLLLCEVVATSRAVAATSSRLSKRSALVDLLRKLETVDDMEIATAYLAGELRQRRTGVGWATVSTMPPPASQPSLTLAELDAELERIAKLSGPGSAGSRTEGVSRLLARATADEQAFVRSLLLGDVRQGALDSAMLDAIATASSVPLAVIRRAVMLRGATGPVAVAALTAGQAAVESFGLAVGQPVRPMLASSATDVQAAFAKLGDASEAVIDTKLDGIRIQVHKFGTQVRVFTRSLDEITARLPEVVKIVQTMPADDVILDGEALSLDPAGRPRPFQETASRTARQLEGSPGSPTDAVTPFFFDCLYVDGDELIDLPLRDRLSRLDSLLPPSFIAPRLVTTDPAAGANFFDDAVATGQEGVVVKAINATYDAGRRGAAWIKVKPRHTLDLVVLAVEWGSGRRTGTLSNIHLGARDPNDGSFVMLGKTFKGMTDEMLAWQTQRFLELETSRSGHVVHVRPQQVVEVAFDGLQRSSRYPGGFALRFARVLRYRDDKSAEEADSIDAVRALAAVG